MASVEHESAASGDEVRADGSPPEGRKRRQLPFGLSVLVNVVVALTVVAIVQALWVKVYSVPSGSMEATLNVGDRMLVNRTAYPDGKAAAQDVIVFEADEAWAMPTASGGPVDAALRAFGDVTGIGRSNSQALVKRVIGAEGQTVECCSADGAVLVDGTPIDEPYVHNDLPFAKDELDCDTPQRSARCFGPVEVPEDSMLVLGDHRSNSADSVVECRGRPEGQADDCARFVRAEDVVGEVFFVMWPPSNWSSPAL